MSNPDEEAILEMVKAIGEIHVEPLADPYYFENKITRDLINRMWGRLQYHNWERDEVTDLILYLHFKIPEEVFNNTEFYNRLADSFLDLLARHIELYTANYPLASRSAIISATSGKLMLDLRSIAPGSDSEF